MPITIEITDEQLHVLAMAVAKMLQPSAEPDDPQVPENSIAIYAVYKEVRISGLYFPAKESVVVSRASKDIPELNALIAGRERMTPSGAAVAVISTLSPRAPQRNGWLFWRIEGTGEALRTIRFA